MRKLMPVTSLLVLMALAFAPASPASAGTSRPAASSSRGITTIDELLKATRQAKADTYLARPGSRIANATEFARMRRYVLRRYAGVHVEHSFRDAALKVVDCVPRAEQPSLRGKGEIAKVDAPPLAAPSERAPEATETSFAKQRELDVRLRRDGRDRLGNSRYCRTGLIPLARVTLVDLSRFETLDAFFAKGDRADEFQPGVGQQHEQLPADDATHYYARGAQFVDNFGANSWLNVWSPTVAEHHMSLSQIWVVGGEGESKQTVEAGWQVYPDKWGSKAALFIYYTTKGYTRGSGCYNVQCSGFVQVANNVYLGGGFTHYSSSGGTQWGFELQFKRDPRNGNWWLFYRGPGAWIPVGYYPHALFGTGQLASNAQKVAYGGEDTGKPNALQMGSGAFASGGFGQAAYQHTAFYIDTKVVSQWAKLSPYVPDPKCYTADIGASAGTWGVYLFFGGPRCPPG
jgi:hypothetical protein